MSYVAVMLLLYPFWPFLASFFVMLATLDIHSQNRRPVPRLSAFPLALPSQRDT